MLDISFQRMLKKEKSNSGTLELWSADVEGMGDFGQYRSKLLELVRLIASFKPLIAVTKVSDRIIMIIKSLLLTPLPSQNLTVLESMQLAVENILGAVFDSQNDENGTPSESQLASCRIVEGRKYKQRNKHVQDDGGLHSMWMVDCTACAWESAGGQQEEEHVAGGRKTCLLKLETYLHRRKKEKAFASLETNPINFGYFSL